MSYPCLIIDKSVIADNVKETVRRCSDFGISVCGVIKGCCGMPEIAGIMTDNGCSQIGSSRISQIRLCREAGIDTEYLLLRIPGISELPDLVRYCDISLQSEWETLQLLEKECEKQDRTHEVIIMADLGDLREGIWDADELVGVCRKTERELSHVELAGIGVNLGCYGAVKPTVQKMKELLALADRVADMIGRSPGIVSGGATTSYPLVHNGTMPAGINHLRIGDNILLSRGLQTNWKITDMDYLKMTGFVIEAEVIEVKEKPSYPQGEFAFNAYGKLPEYTDRGIRKRALLALGNADAGDVREMIPILPGIEIIGGSSDHTILDITDCAWPLQPGDTVKFYPRYINLLSASASADVKKCFVSNS